MKEFDQGVDIDALPDSVLGEMGFAGGIVPHAGWYFSGKTSYSVFRSIDRNCRLSGRRPDLFFVFGMHLPPRAPNQIFIDDGLETPLGPVPVNREAAERMARGFEFTTQTARDSISENTIELQLPFIRHLFPDADVVTMGIAPDQRAAGIGELALEISRSLGKTACFIGSTDLTHYGPNYDFMPRGIGTESVRWVREQNDREIIDAFLSAGPDEILQRALSSHNACCPGAAAAAVAAVRKGGVSAGRLVEYTTSYDKNPDSSFVGYAGILF
jgi:AmmeMemoRadiSam system protein B